MSDEASLPPRTGAARPKKKEGNEPEKHHGVSMTRRIVSWIFILILLGVVIFEWRAKTNYEKSLAALQDKVRQENESNREMTLPDADGIVAGTIKRSESELRGAPVIEYRWRSLFRNYVVYLVLERGTNTVMDLQTEKPD